MAYIVDPNTGQLIDTTTGQPVTTSSTMPVTPQAPGGYNPNNNFSMVRGGYAPMALTAPPPGGGQGGAPTYDPKNPAPYINYFYNQRYGTDAPPDQISYWSQKLANPTQLGNGQMSTPGYYMNRLMTDGTSQDTTGAFGFGGAYGAPNLSQYMSMFSYPSFSAPAPFQAPGSPSFDQFGYQPLQTPAPWTMPTAADESNDPGYQFRLQQGENALESSAAARGTLFSGNTLQDVLKYGQDYASNEFQNVVNRSQGAYQTNVGTQLAANQQQYDQASGAYGTNVNTQLSADQQAYNQALGAYQTNFGNALNAYTTNFGTYTGTAGLGLNAYNAAGQMGLGYGYYGLAGNAQQYNQLYGLANLGYNATSQQGAYGDAYANQYMGSGQYYTGQATNAYTGAGNAAASGIVGSANAINAGISGAVNGGSQALLGAYYGNSQRSSSSPSISSPGGGYSYTQPPSGSGGYGGPLFGGPSGNVPYYFGGGPAQTSRGPSPSFWQVGG